MDDSDVRFFGVILALALVFTGSPILALIVFALVA